MTEQTPDEPNPNESMPDDPFPNDPFPNESMPDESTPAEVAAPRGLKGWLARRAETMLSKPRRVRPDLSEPGEHQVVLQLVGHSPMPVMTIISEATGLDFMSAGKLARDAPVVVVSQISEASAERLVRRLQKAGAKAIAAEQYRPQ